MSVTLQHAEHSKDVHLALNSMRTVGLCCDVVLSTQDGGVFQVHKTVMFGCSPYFRTAFTTSLVTLNCGDGQDRSFIRIPNVSSVMLEHVIQYAYNRSVLVSRDNACDLLIAADQFIVLGLIGICTKFLVKQLEVENCLGMWRLAKDYFAQELEKGTWKFILSRFREVSKESSEFLELSLTSLKELLAEDALNVSREIVVWKAVKRWMNHDILTRLSHVPELLSHLRLATMSNEDFQYVITDWLVFGDPRCQPCVRSVVEHVIGSLERDAFMSEQNPLFPVFLPRLPHALIFCMGGWGVNGPMIELEVYDWKADFWKRIEFNDTFPPRVYHQCISLGTNVYVVGGSDGFNTTNSCWRFNTAKLKFEEVSPMVERRCFLSATTLKGDIYAMGGFDGNRERSKTAEFYSVERNQWTYVAPMTLKRSDASCCQHNNKVFIAGGFDGSTYLQSAEVYDPLFNQWNLIPPMNSCRSGLSCVSLGNYVYAIGGSSGNKRMQVVEKYDPENEQWYAVKPMKMSRSNFATAVKDIIRLISTADTRHVYLFRYQEKFKMLFKIHRFSPYCPSINNRHLTLVQNHEGPCDPFGYCTRPFGHYSA